ncbi:MAG: RecX family transcriptional regulator [Bacteroidales bacterium]|nr:RecX family transcriptional regulator [Bacteroidales bacterium]
MANTTAGERMLYEEFLEKARRFCAYRDRCKKETADRLSQLGANRDLTAKILDTLLQEGFLDEQRFARAYARGKFEHNHWGRTRIKQELAFRQIDENTIAEALFEIDENKYLEVLNDIAAKKLKSLKEPSDFTARGKTAEHCIRKGFEPDLVWRVINKL